MRSPSRRSWRKLYSRKPEANELPNWPKDRVTTTSSLGWTGVCTTNRSNACQTNAGPISRHGCKELFNFEKMASPSNVPSAESQPPQSTSFGCVNGVRDKGINQHGRSESLDMMKCQGRGTWQDLQVLAAHQHQGWANTLDATPSTYDQRSQLWVFGLCVHTMSLGQLQRLGAITGIPSNPQNKTRALAKHTKAGEGHCGKHGLR